MCPPPSWSSIHFCTSIEVALMLKSSDHPFLHHSLLERSNLSYCTYSLFVSSFTFFIVYSDEKFKFCLIYWNINIWDVSPNHLFASIQENVYLFLAYKWMSSCFRMHDHNDIMQKYIFLLELWLTGPNW